MLETAILRTVLYADVFQFALTIEELTHFLIHDQHITQSDIEKTLYQSDKLKQCLSVQSGYVALDSRYISLRQQREQLAQDLLPKAHRYGLWLAQIPFVRMVALTGALAMKNPAHPQDDVDYLLVVEEGRVWLARAFAVLIVRLVRCFGTELCPNYVVSTQKLTQQRQNLYIAHEVMQMIPLYGESIYAHMIAQNSWVNQWLRNAPLRKSPRPTCEKTSHIKKWVEIGLSGKIGTWLETWEFKRKSRKFQQSHIPSTGAEITQNTVKGHFNDHATRILEAYYARLQAYQIYP